MTEVVYDKDKDVFMAKVGSGWKPIKCKACGEHLKIAIVQNHKCEKGA